MPDFEEGAHDMKALRSMTAMLLIIGLGAPVGAEDLRKSAGKAVESETAPPKTMTATPSKKGLFWAGTGMFVGGMAVGLFGFVNDKNGKYAEFGEAQSSDKHLGAAGLSVAFAGGALMFLGARQMKAAPSVAFGPHAVAVSKRVSW
jgi:hypothetical protein